jgi:GNAT superfamily N-acetyltransferase
MSSLPLPDVTDLDLVCRRYRFPADLADIEQIRGAIRVIEPRAWLPGPDAGGEAALEAFCVIGSVNGSAVAYTWMDRWVEADGTRLWLLLGWVDPVARGRGIGRALLTWQERAALGQAIEEHGRVPDAAMFGANADDDQPATRDLLLAAGYRVAFTGVSLVCDARRNAEIGLPDGFADRPVEAAAHRRIHAAIEESFQHSRIGHVPRTFEEYLHDVETRQYDTSQWCVAWDGDDVAGVVIAEKAPGGQVILPWVAVRTPWRRRGLAKAMLRTVIARCAARGVRQVALATNVENENHTVGLYEQVGFRVVQHTPRYRKPMLMTLNRIPQGY